MVQLLIASGHVNLKEVCLDATKIEANVNRHTFEQMDAEKIKKTIDMIDKACAVKQT